MAAAGVVLVAAIWWAGRPAPTSSGTTGVGNIPGSGNVLLRPDDAALVARGERIYAQNCASCHGADLKGQPGWRRNPRLAPAHDETGHTWHHPDPLLVAVTRDGTVFRGGAMPPFGNVLSEEDIIAVLSFIKSRWPEPIRAAHDRINARAGGRG